MENQNVDDRRWHRACVVDRRDNPNNNRERSAMANLLSMGEKVTA